MNCEHCEYENPKSVRPATTTTQSGDSVCDYHMEIDREITAEIAEYEARLDAEYTHENQVG